MFNNNYGTTVFFFNFKKEIWAHTIAKKEMKMTHCSHSIFWHQNGKLKLNLPAHVLDKDVASAALWDDFFSEALNHKYHQLVKGPAQEVCAFFSLCSVGSPTSLNPCGLNLPSGWSGNTSVLPSLRNNWASGLRLATFMSRPNVARIVFSLPILLIIIVHYYLNGIFFIDQWVP